MAASQAQALACDLGSDAIVSYSIDAKGAITETGRLLTSPGSGPRHVAFHPSLPVAYALHEMGNYVAVLSLGELHKMNNVASEYARKYRFRHNGSKSAIMLFNADKNLTTRVHRQRWSLSGERVEIKDHYKYLGADIQQNISK